jgi:hypothetical protein
MKRNSFVVLLAIIFILTSALLYLAHYLIFRDVHHLFIFLVGDLAFLPLEVFLVSIVIERILHRREKQEKLQKLNMVVGAFFSEAGNYLLQYLLKHLSNKEDIAAHLKVDDRWTKQDFQKAAEFARNLPMEVDYHSLNLNQLKDFLASRREFILTLLENPSILEHDRFSDLLWAVTHLDEELAARPSLTGLPEKDLNHLAGDIRRMYGYLTSEWLDYVEHLQSKYPSLFSLVVRTHPFQPHPSPIVTE